MNVLMLCLSFPPITGGASVYYEWLVRRLSRDKLVAKIIVLTRLDYSRPIERENRTTIYRIIPHSLSDIRPIKILFLILTTLSLITVLPIIVTKFTINIVHYDCRKSYLAVSILKILKLLRIPVVAEERGMSKKLPLLQTFEAMIVCGFKTKQMVEERYPCHHNLIYHMPVPLILKEKRGNKKNELINKKEKYILFSGHITHAKGIFELLEAIKLLREEKINTKLVIIGRSRIYKFENHLKDIDNVLYLGSVEHKDALWLTKNCSILILPSKSEGVPRVCLEALFFRRKVIFPPNIKEFEQHCPEFVLRDINPCSIKDKILFALNNNKRPNYPISDHMPEKIYGQIMVLYRCLLENHPSKVN